MKKIVGFFVCLLCLGFAGAAAAQTKTPETAPQKNRATSVQGNVAALAQNAATVTPNETPEIHKIRAAAERGDADAQYTLGLMYEVGSGVTLDREQAIVWYRKAAEQENSSAQWRLARMLTGDEATAWRRKAEEAPQRYYMKLRAAAERGDADAQKKLGDGYKDGSFGPANREQAIVWYRKAAEQGNLEAQWKLGWLLTGDEAVKWTRKAAESGYVAAEYDLGHRYLSGDGVAKDVALAIEWLRKAAEHGSWMAASDLGYLYMDGKKVAQDDAQAVAWFRKSLIVSGGWGPDQQALGDMYIQWRGIAPDREQAIAWIRKAASEGDSVAQYALGEMYLSGKGVKQDREQAVFWLKKAAREGDGNGPASDALICLGEAETDGCDADDGD